MKRVLTIVGLVVLVLVVAAVGGGAWLLASSLPRMNGTVEVAGLQAPVTIRRDARGVPHIAAASADDAYFALGYVHAQDRLWQMESMRRAGAGRLSEVVGAAALDTDRFMRTLGLYRLAERQAERLDPATRAPLDAYARGVNAWLDAREGALPPEFLALRFEPEPWRPADSLVWIRLMGLRLTMNWRRELLRARLARHLPPERAAELWPPYPPDGPVAVEATAALTRGLPLDALAVALPGGPGVPYGASNNWVVSGSRTASGKPIVANDPHLRLTAPVLWYLARLEAPGLTLAGATAPGVPAIILGHNGRVAWGFTNTGGDTADLFVERLDPADPSRYLSPQGSRPFVVREEVIRIKDGADEFLRVRETRHGPVISDVVRTAGDLTEADTVLALAATFLRDDDDSPRAVWRMNTAADAASFAAALEDLHAPQQSIVFADTGGTAGFVAAGRVPVRRGGTGRVPSPGWSGEADWVGFIPFHGLPRVMDPDSGRVATANHRIVGPAYPYYITDDWDPPYRARRILDRLDAGTQSVESTVALQLDTVSLMARELLPLMLAVEPASPRDAGAVDLLRTWDGAMDRERAEPLLFTAWLAFLNRAVYADELGDLFESYAGLRPRFIASVLRERQHWCDDVATDGTVEDCGTLLVKSLTEAVDGLAARLGPDMAAWRWGDLHQARLHHRLFTRVPGARAIADVDVATDGGNYTVHRGAGPVSDGDDPFPHVHGAGLRAVYDLSDLDNSRFVIATGQSGHPLSSHYRDQVEDWRDGRAFRLDAPDRAGARLVLTPAPQ